MRGRALTLRLAAMLVLLAGAGMSLAQPEADRWRDSPAREQNQTLPPDSATASDRMRTGESAGNPAGDFLFPGLMRFSMSSLEELLRAHLLGEDEDVRLTEVFRADSSLALSLFQLRGEEYPHYHLRSDLWVYIWRGRGQIALASEERDYGPGQFIQIPAGTLHAFRNISGAPTVALIWQRPPMLAEEIVQIVPPEIRAQQLADSLRARDREERPLYKSPR